MHPKSKLHFIEFLYHRHWHMSGPNCIIFLLDVSTKRIRPFLFWSFLATSKIKQPRRAVQSQRSKIWIQTIHRKSSCWGVIGTARPARTKAWVPIPILTNHGEATSQKPQIFPSPARFALYLENGKQFIKKKIKGQKSKTHLRLKGWF